MYDYLNFYGYYFFVYVGIIIKIFIFWVSGYLNWNFLCEFLEYFGLIVMSMRKEVVGGMMSGIMNILLIIEIKE